MECSCFLSLRSYRRSPCGLHSFCGLRLCFSKNASKPTSSVSVIAFRCHVRVFFLGRRLALAFLLLTQCFNRKRTQAGVFRARFFLLCVFLMVLLSGNHPERVCTVVFLRAFILLASFLSDSAPRRRTQAGFTERTCTESALPSWLYRVGFTGLTLPDRLCWVGFAFRRRTQTGFAGRTCIGWACTCWLYRVGLRHPSGSHKGSRWPFSRIFARGISYRKTY